MSKNNRVWRLQERPVGNITNNTLSLEKENIPQPKDGECLFQLNYLSLDPTNRIWMSDEKQYMPPVELRDPMRGVVCGTILESKTPAFKKGDIVIYESTVYPGCTEEDCVPVLEKTSGLKYNEDFFCGYSPERINPGDKVNTLTKIKKVTIWFCK